MADATYLLKGRECLSCKAVKAHIEANFRSVTEQRNGRPYTYIKRTCRQCEHDQRVEWGRKNRQRQNDARARNMTPERTREKNLRRLYGISQADYDRLLAAQGGGCSICGSSKNERHGSGREIPLAVDHDHDTGKVRGLLCGSCNRGLGDFRDSIKLMEHAIQYLRSHHG